MMRQNKGYQPSGNGKPYVIPARPESLIAMVELMKSGDPDAQEIAGVLKQDVYLHSGVLSAVNAPHMGISKKITDLSHAITLLGLDKLFAIVRLAALKNGLSKTERLDRFWDSATEVAELSANLAGRLSDVDSHTAYTLGMMHDCGIPMMLEQWSEYKPFLREINGDNLATMGDAELQRFGVNHFELGAEIAKEWYMPEEVCAAIRYQSEYEKVIAGEIECSEDSRTLIVILALAKDISRVHRRFWRIYDTADSLPGLSGILDYLGVPEIEYLDLRDDFLGSMVQDITDK